MEPPAGPGSAVLSNPKAASCDPAKAADLFVYLQTTPSASGAESKITLSETWLMISVALELELRGKNGLIVTPELGNSPSNAIQQPLIHVDHT